jgi:cation:H+ antiporter
MLLGVLFLLLGIAGLFFGGEWLVRGASRLASALGVPPLVIGVAVVSVGTSFPELLVSISAALAGTNGIVLGNVIGSNIANIGLILGLAALIYPVAVHWRLIRIEVPLMVGLSVVSLLMALDGEINRLEGGLLLVGLVVVIVSLIRFSERDHEAMDAEILEFEEKEHLLDREHPVRALLLLLAGIAVLGGGAQLMVRGAVTVAQGLGVSDVVIGLSVVALGTSLPELVTSVLAARRGEPDIAIGNVVGSNIMNLLFILGATAAIHPIPLDPAIVLIDLAVMIAFAGVLWLSFCFDEVVGRIEAVAFLAGYVGFIAYSFLK